MIEALIGLIFLLVLLGVVWWAFQQLIGLVPLSEPFATLIRVLVVLVGVVVVLYVLVALLNVGGINVALPKLG
jgi:hypothetical protein